MKIRKKGCIKSFIDILIRIWCDQAGMRLRCHQCIFCSTWIFRFCTGRFLANHKKLSLHYNRDRMDRIDHRIYFRLLRIDNKHRILRKKNFWGLGCFFISVIGYFSVLWILNIIDCSTFWDLWDAKNSSFYDIFRKRKEWKLALTAGLDFFLAKSHPWDENQSA